MKFKSILLIATALTTTINCNNSNSSSKSEDSKVNVDKIQSKEKIIEKQTTITKESTSNSEVIQYEKNNSKEENIIDKGSTNSELLQGKWQHVEDKSNYLIFENGLRKEIADGSENWDEEKYVLSNSCLNISDKENNIKTEELLFISCLNSDMCWHILSLDENNLTLSYMGRGNSLNYLRVK